MKFRSCFVQLIVGAQLVLIVDYILLLDKIVDSWYMIEGKFNYIDMRNMKTMNIYTVIACAKLM